MTQLWIVKDVQCVSLSCVELDLKAGSCHPTLIHLSVSVKGLIKVLSSRKYDALEGERQIERRVGVSILIDVDILCAIARARACEAARGLSSGGFGTHAKLYNLLLYLSIQSSAIESSPDLVWRLGAIVLDGGRHQWWRVKGRKKWTGQWTRNWVGKISTSEGKSGRLRIYG